MTEEQRFFGRALKFLESTDLFASLTPEQRSDLAAGMHPVHLQAGDVLLREGDDGADLFIIVSGRLRASVKSPSGDSVVVGEAGAGEVIGEMAMLASEARSATLTATRDSLLFRLDEEAFRQFIHDHPAGLLEVTRQLVGRVRTANRREFGTGRTAIAIVPIDPGIDVDRLATTLGGELGKRRRIATIDRAAVDGALGPRAADAAPGEPEYGELTRWLHERELDHDLLVYVGDRDLGPWTKRVMRQADVVAFATTPRGPTELAPPEVWLEDHGDLLRPRVELLVVHPAATERPRSTRRIVAKRRHERLLHLRDGDPKHLARVARFMTGEAIALVLSGGGARGLAHLGVVAALRARGVPIDAVAGASFGASVAGGVALEMDDATILELEKAVTVDQGSLVDFTFPATALARGVRLSGGIHRSFGEADIEDAWIPFACVSTDLTDGVLRVHDRGPLWKAVRASVAIPGIFPPVRGEDGHVLVDGGVMDNLPVGVARRMVEGGTVIASDLRAGISLPSADLGDDGLLSGWQVLGRRLSPWSPRRSVPRMIDVMLRVTEVSSVKDPDPVDVLFQPDVERFGILDFASYREIVAEGRRHADEVLDSVDLAGVLGIG